MTKRNRTLAKQFKGYPCTICGMPGEGDHILNFKGNPDRDVERNMWTLCRAHHVEKGWGLYKFVKKHHLEVELEKRGFFLYQGRWRLDESN